MIICDLRPVIKNAAVLLSLEFAIWLVYVVFNFLAPYSLHNILGIITGLFVVSVWIIGLRLSITARRVLRQNYQEPNLIGLEIFIIVSIAIKFVQMILAIFYATVGDLDFPAIMDRLVEVVPLAILFAGVPIAVASVQRIDRIALGSIVRRKWIIALTTSGILLAGAIALMTFSELTDHSGGGIWAESHEVLLIVLIIEICAAASFRIFLLVIVVGVSRRIERTVQSRSCPRCRYILVDIDRGCSECGWGMAEAV